jgi:hypothetical protein
MIIAICFSLDTLTHLFNEISIGLQFRQLCLYLCYSHIPLQACVCKDSESPFHSVDLLLCFSQDDACLS